MVIQYDSPADLPESVRELNFPFEDGMPKKRNKYGAKKTSYNSVLYDSAGEAHGAQELDLELRAGTVLWWARQPRFPLEEGVEYVADFIVVREESVTVEDFKGFDTSGSRQKRKQVKARYGLEVKVIKG